MLNFQTIYFQTIYFHTIMSILGALSVTLVVLLFVRFVTLVVPTVKLGIYPGPILDGIRYSLVFTVASMIQTSHPGIDIDVGNQVGIYATVLIILWISVVMRDLYSPKLYIQFELLRTKQQDNTKIFSLIDLKDPSGSNIRIYFRFNRNVTGHYVSWNGQIWYAVVSNNVPPYFTPNGLSQSEHDHLYSQMVDNDDINLYERVFQIDFPGPNMGHYMYLCHHYDVRTFNGLHDHEIQVLPINYIIGNVRTGQVVLPLGLYKWPLKTEEAIVISNC